MPPAHQYDELVHGPDKAPIRSWNCLYRSDIPSAHPTVTEKVAKTAYVQGETDLIPVSCPTQGDTPNVSDSLVSPLRITLPFCHSSWLMKATSECHFQRSPVSLISTRSSSHFQE